ncbi:MAG: hypothetical protein QF619_09865, partial [Candidatus Binatia bacterium]|nr:hypothetical protein [Candidatus Binatia bacterium]
MKQQSKDGEKMGGGGGESLCGPALRLGGRKVAQAGEGGALYAGAEKRGSPSKGASSLFQNWASFTIEINSLEGASYHKHISFLRRHRDLMGPMAQKLADELIHPEPPGHIHVVL